MTILVWFYQGFDLAANSIFRPDTSLGAMFRFIVWFGVILLILVGAGILIFTDQTLGGAMLVAAGLAAIAWGGMAR